jgi:hypothetical protein
MRERAEATGGTLEAGLGAPAVGSPSGRLGRAAHDPGTHDDWDTYDRVMAEERRAAVLITPRRTYSSPTG